MIPIVNLECRIRLLFASFGEPVVLRLAMFRWQQWTYVR